MRQSLESGVQVVHRGSGMAEFPARYQLVLAANPCPCGNFGARDAKCTCASEAQRRYRARLSGPLLDRIDVQLRVERVSAARQRVAQADREAGLPTGPTTAETRDRVQRARAAARHRLRATPWRTNAEVAGTWFRARANRLPFADTSDLDHALDAGTITMRGHDRILRVAWSIADLEGADRPSRAHVLEAISYRTTNGFAA